ncbi:MAG: extracellular solute-binding protein [Chloroflexi bacterium]|nr:extracellular solute-binding protein [Chloroflexota bacterium]
MSTKRNLVLAGTTLALAFLVACGGDATPTQAPTRPPTEAVQATEASQATEAPLPTDTAAPAAEAQQFITWYQYDEQNEDPKSDERVGNAYLRKTIPLFNEQFSGKLTWVNQPQAWDKMTLALVAAVQGGGEVPDLMHTGSGELVTLYNNGAVEDLTDWIKSMPWFSDLDPNAVQACTAPDGRIYCVPVSEQPQLVFYWSEHFPNGYPKTPEDFLKQAEELKQKNVYAITYFGSTDFDGEGTTRYFWMAVSSFGGTFDDGQGNMRLNTPENVNAIEFMREIVAKGYSPEIVFAGKFQEEEPMKTAEAASFPTGVFGYRYVNPLKSPSGKEYNTKTEKDMLDAIEAGDVKLSSFVAPEGQKPSCGLSVSGFVIPKGAKNMDGAKQYLNWIMDPQNNPDWVQAPGAGLPALGSIRAAQTFQTTFYKQAIEATAGLCKPWYGSLTKLPDAKKVIATAIYRLIKEDPTADIAAELTKAQDEYNNNK